MYIRTQKELENLVDRLRGAPRLAIDTEFVRERQYYPRLEIIQVATDSIEAIVDYRALGTLEPLTEILQDIGTLKIFHAGSQDLEIFVNLTDRVPRPLFDTQVAAAMVGLGQQVGYARLVENLLGVALRKSETLTDWSRRPLTDAQMEYARNDVRYLLEVHRLLEERLAEMGRAQWLEDEWEAMGDPDSYRRVHPREAYRRVQGSHRLRPHDLAVLRELAEWREREGIRRDRAPSLIVRDNVLVELARRAPRAVEGLHDIRSLHPREIERNGPALLEVIERGKALPRDRWPQQPQRLTLSDQEQSLVGLLQAWLRARADESNIAASYLATAAQLRELVTAAPDERARLEVLRGWRRRLVGAELLALIEGRAALAWHPGEARLQLVREEEGA